MPTEALGNSPFLAFFEVKKKPKSEVNLSLSFTFKKVTELCNFILEN